MMMLVNSLRAVVFAVGVMIVGCGVPLTVPDGMPGDGDGNGGGAQGDTISFALDVQPILTTFCSTCHRVGGLADARGIALRLTEQEALDGLIGGMSVQDPSLAFVVPGDSSASLLFQKISGDDPPVGNRMPFSQAPLSSNQIAIIRDWIDQGAMLN